MQAIHVVGVADMKVSAQQGDSIITYALGSCLGITIYDLKSCVGGMLHAMLPQSSIDSVKAAQNPFMFVDTGVPELFRQCYKLGAQKERLMVKVAGGACARGTEDDDYFQIGKRNFIMLRKLLWKNGVLVSSYEVGGCYPRTMSLDIATGDVLLRVNGNTKKL